MNHGGKRRKAGRKLGPIKIYWAIRITPRQQRYIREAARKVRTPYGEFVYKCVNAVTSSQS
jgi:hypothetical protein